MPGNLKKKPCHLRVRPAKPLGGSHFLRKFSVLFSHFSLARKKRTVSRALRNEHPSLPLYTGFMEIGTVPHVKRHAVTPLLIRQAKLSGNRQNGCGRK